MASFLHLFVWALARQRRYCCRKHPSVAGSRPLYVCSFQAHAGNWLFAIFAPGSADDPVARGGKMASFSFATIRLAEDPREPVWSLSSPCAICVMVNFVDSERWHTLTLRSGVSDTAQRPV